MARVALTNDSGELYGAPATWLNGRFPTKPRTVLTGGLAPSDPFPKADATRATVATSTGFSGEASFQATRSYGIMTTQLGSAGVFTPADGYQEFAGSTHQGIDFYISGSTWCEFIWKEKGTVNASKWWIWIDGAPLTPTPEYLTTTDAWGRYFTKITLPDTNRHRVTIMSAVAQAYGTLYWGPSGTITPTPRKLKLGVVTDSFGAGTSSAHALESFPGPLARSLGMDVVVSATGGTGYLAGGSEAFNKQARIDLIRDAKPDALLFYGSVNDSVTGLGAAATSTWDAYSAAMPGVPIVVCGPQPSADEQTVSQSRADTNNALRVAAEAHPAVIAYHDLIGTADGVVPAAYSSAKADYQAGEKVTHLGSVWRCLATYTNTLPAPGVGNGGMWELLTHGYTGTGNTAAPANNGTRDVLLGGDDVHPTVAGSNVLGALAAPLLLADIRGE